MAYESDESGKREVYVQSAPVSGAKWQVWNGGGQQPRWRRDGKELFYVSADSKLTAVQVTIGQSLTFGHTQTLFPLTITGNAFGNVLFGVEPSHDGTRFLVTAPPATGTTTPPQPLT